jgi:hypothetical protein
LNPSWFLTRLHVGPLTIELAQECLFLQAFSQFCETSYPGSYPAEVVVTRDSRTDPKVQRGWLLVASRLDALLEFLVLLNFARE